MLIAPLAIWEKSSDYRNRVLQILLGMVYYGLMEGDKNIYVDSLFFSLSCYPFVEIAAKLCPDES